MALTLYDTVTKQVYKGGYGTQTIGDARAGLVQYVSTDFATYGRLLSTSDPNVKPDPALTVVVYNNQRPTGSQQDAINQGFLDSLAALNPKLPIAQSVVDATGRNVTYIPAREATAQEAKASGDAKAWASFLYLKYDQLFYSNGLAESGWAKSVSTLMQNQTQDRIEFAQHVPNADTSLFDYGRNVALNGLERQAYAGTPAAPGKLFGFLPLRVPGVVQNIANLGVIVGGAYAPGILAGEAAGATTSAGVSTTVTGSELTAVGAQGGSVAAPLGIRGAQAVSLAATGGSTGGTVGLAPLVSTSYEIGAAGSLVAQAPALAAISPTAANIGVTGAITSRGFTDIVSDFFQNKVTQAKNAALENPVKTGLSAAGTALTVKQIAGAKDPFAALVNTISSAVGLGPIIKPDQPGGPGALPPSLVPGYGGGGGGGGGGSYGGATITETGNMILPIMGMIVGLLVLLALLRR